MSGSMQLIHDFEHRAIEAGRDLGEVDQTCVRIACVFAGNPMPGVTVNRRRFLAGLWARFGVVAPKVSRGVQREAYARHVEFYGSEGGRGIASCPGVVSAAVTA